MHYKYITRSYSKHKIGNKYFQGSKYNRFSVTRWQYSQEKEQFASSPKDGRNAQVSGKTKPVDQIWALQSDWRFQCRRNICQLKIWGYQPAIFAHDQIIEGRKFSQHCNQFQKWVPCARTSDTCCYCTSKHRSIPSFSVTGRRSWSHLIDMANTNNVSLAYLPLAWWEANSVVVLILLFVILICRLHKLYINKYLQEFALLIGNNLNVGQFFFIHLSIEDLTLIPPNDCIRNSSWQRCNGRSGVCNIAYGDSSMKMVINLSFHLQKEVSNTSRDADVVSFYLKISRNILRSKLFTSTDYMYSGFSFE